ncbi:hypothetical protein AVDCRST_MAG81-559 [uncultured Synechococcales cyanobacterium]|uniref:Uncharacterized protein n=1 Tax=uncultured Synechococcales cyanobacterium TaxID=1936017 RepID=A0A6J4UY25_9CYAN|nr:hypothetical protein AVDCRST_MAG81-559 [uncultured Synechococcales cyanobacterium]
MKERATHQIGDIVQAYDGCIGRVVYTHQRTDTAFPDEQHVWSNRVNPNKSFCSAQLKPALGLIVP